MRASTRQLLDPAMRPIATTVRRVAMLSTEWRGALVRIHVAMRVPRDTTRVPVPWEVQGKPQLMPMIFAHVTGATDDHQVILALPARLVSRGTTRKGDTITMLVGLALQESTLDTTRHGIAMTARRANICTRTTQPRLMTRSAWTACLLILPHIAVHMASQTHMGVTAPLGIIM